MTAALAAGPAPQPPPLAVLAVVAPAADVDAGPTAPLSPTRAAARRARKRWKSAFRHVLHPRTSRQKVVCAVVWTTVAVAGLAFAVFVLPRLMQKVGSGWSGAAGRRDGPSARLPTLYSFSSPSRAGHRPPRDHPPPLAPPPSSRSPSSAWSCSPWRSSRGGGRSGRSPLSSGAATLSHSPPSPRRSPWHYASASRAAPACTTAWPTALGGTPGFAHSSSLSKKPNPGKSSSSSASPPCRTRR